MNLDFCLNFFPASVSWESGCSRNVLECGSDSIMWHSHTATSTPICLSSNQTANYFTLPLQYLRKNVFPFTLPHKQIIAFLQVFLLFFDSGNVQCAFPCNWSSSGLSILNHSFCCFSPSMKSFFFKDDHLKMTCHVLSSTPKQSFLLCVCGGDGPGIKQVLGALEMRGWERAC